MQPWKMMIDALKIHSAYQCYARMKPAIAHIPPSGVSASLAPEGQLPVSFNKQQLFFFLLQKGEQKKKPALKPTYFSTLLSAYFKQMQLEKEIGMGPMR